MIGFYCEALSIFKASPFGFAFLFFFFGNSGKASSSPITLSHAARNPTDHIHTSHKDTVQMLYALYPVKMSCSLSGFPI
jgi:hypothetical protein